MNLLERVVCALLVCPMMLNAGCTGRLSNEYGGSEGFEARQSPASVSLFRNMCESEGHQTVVVRSLSPRAMTTLEAIVWTPDSFETHRPATYEWLDRWLVSGDRTLVYVGRDFSPLADYWSQVCDELASKESSSNEILPARQSLAEQQRDLDKLRASTRAKIATPWFVSDHSRSREERVERLSGPWAEDIDADNSRLFLRSFVEGFEDGSKQSLIDEFNKKPADTSSKPKSDSEFDFQWGTTDADMLATIQSLSNEDMPILENLLATKEGKPLIAEITTDKWKRSRVIFVANASLLSNISLVNSSNRVIAKKLIEILPGQNVGFIAGAYDPPVRKDSSGEQQKGFEMLTIWPLNVITLHAVFMGMLVLLAVFPIFGRAKRLPQKSTRDFGQHVDAMGALLLKSADRFYAMATIADYFRYVRKEPTSPWAHVDPAVQQEPKSPFAVTTPPVQSPGDASP